MGELFRTVTLRAVAPQLMQIPPAFAVYHKS
jgi:hypothetical protein